LSSTKITTIRIKVSRVAMRMIMNSKTSNRIRLLSLRKEEDPVKEKIYLKNSYPY
jgi:hypothetical protein